MRHFRRFIPCRYLREMLLTHAFGKLEEVGALIVGGFILLPALLRAVL